MKFPAFLILSIFVILMLLFMAKGKSRNTSQPVQTSANEQLVKDIKNKLGWQEVEEKSKPIDIDFKLFQKTLAEHPEISEVKKKSNTSTCRDGDYLVAAKNASWYIHIFQAGSHKQAVDIAAGWLIWNSLVFERNPELDGQTIGQLSVGHRQMGRKNTPWVDIIFVRNNIAVAVYSEKRSNGTYPDPRVLAKLLDRWLECPEQLATLNMSNFLYGFANKFKEHFKLDSIGFENTPNIQPTILENEELKIIDGFKMQYDSPQSYRHISGKLFYRVHFIAIDEKGKSQISGNILFAIDEEDARDSLCRRRTFVSAPIELVLKAYELKKDGPGTICFLRKFDKSGNICRGVDFIRNNLDIKVSSLSDDYSALKFAEALDNKIQAARKSGQ